MKFEEVCRVCLKKDTPLESLFPYGDLSRYSSKIEQSAGVRMSPEDSYPSYICQGCVANLNISHHFVTTCQQSDRTLKGITIEQGVIHIKQESPTAAASQEFEVELVDYAEINHDWQKDIKFNANKLKHETKEIKQGKEENIKNNIEKPEENIKKEKMCLSCSECGLSVSNKAALVVHFRKHSGEKPHKCPHCSEKFSQTGTLNVHIKNKHSCKLGQTRERRFSCETCKKKFFSKSNLRLHMRIHTDDHAFVCETCNRGFTQQGTLIRHRRMHTGERPFPCKLCSKSFFDSTLLMKHQFTHSDEKKFTCPTCGKSVKTKCSLSKHLLIHGEKKPVMCEICGTASSNPGNLRAHIKKHHSEKSGFCPECNKRFPDLQAHMRKHTGENAFLCTTCGNGFTSKISLAVHSRTHTRAFKFHCKRDNCSESFTKKSELKMHTAKSHSNIVFKKEFYN